MFDTLALTPSMDRVYPERQDLGGEGWLDRVGTAAVGVIARKLRSRPGRVRSIVANTAAHAHRYAGLDAVALREQAREVARLLRREGLTSSLVAQAFALIRATSGVMLGKPHFDTQLIGGWVLLNGMVAEMYTGEGKTLTATLPACTAALAGIPVHVVTVNDYLVERDCEITRPVYEALGLTVASVTEDMQHAQRQLAYACDVVYCTNKTIVFDYLRDRIVLGNSSTTLHLQIEKIHGGATRVSKLLLRGLSFAIVDEADSVLVDEARTPLIISAEVASEDEALVAAQALEIGRQMVEGEDYILVRMERRMKLTDIGRQHIIDLCKALGGVWAMSLRREELIVQALTALELFNLDEHYLVREGKIQIIDEFTGRVMADRSWSHGLQQLIEVKEGLELSPRKESLARISYQKFFRRYKHLSGMTGTAKEVSGEMGAIYNLPVVRVPTHRPSRRVYHPDLIFETDEERWACVVERIAALHAKGQPVLLGTRSVASSEIADAALTASGLAHSVLNAKQDGEEARIVAAAGEAGRITIATNMAGRGTDIALGAGVEGLGGLAVILSERHEAGRIDRQLAGRCARQGDPGHVQAILSLQDSLLDPYRSGLVAWLVRTLTRPGTRLGQAARRLFISYAQYRTERAQSQVRKALLKSDQQLGNVLSFSGRPE